MLALSSDDKDCVRQVLAASAGVSILKVDKHDLRHIMRQEDWQRFLYDTAFRFRFRSLKVVLTHGRKGFATSVLRKQTWPIRALGLGTFLCQLQRRYGHGPTTQTPASSNNVAT